MLSVLSVLSESVLSELPSCFVINLRGRGGCREGVFGGTLPARMLRARPSGPQWLKRSRHCGGKDVLGFLRSARVRILQHRTSASSEEEQQTVGADVPGDACSPAEMIGDRANRTYEL